MDDRRDPLLGLPMKFLDIGSFDDEVEDEEYDRGEILPSEEEEGTEHDATDSLFPVDLTEDYATIEPGHLYGNAPATVDALLQHDSPTLATSVPPPNSQLLSQPLLLRSDDESDLLPGETLQLKVTDVLFLPDKLLGTLIVTSYRLQFTPNGPSPIATWRSGDMFKFPVTHIGKIVRKANLPSDEITIFCKDGRQNLLFRFGSETQAKRAHSLLLTLAFPVSQGVGDKWFFCFSQPSKTDLKPLSELLACPVMTEEIRFRETVVNWDYAMCASYPKAFLVPKQITDMHLKQVAQFRSKGRIPALSWYDKRSPNKGGTIWRCSQPKVGFAASVSVEDEALVETIRRNTAAGMVLIVDCRSAMAAMANKARGMGTEDVTRYRSTKMQFENIANYHSIRTSYASLCKFLNKPLTTREACVEESFAVEVENTKWLYHLRTILAAAVKVAEASAALGYAVIVHCSDGWDRTPQITALAQVLVDPGCRTRVGFVRMIHREWVLFGHKFRDRLGVGFDAEDEEERAPVFIQFLDCVWQLKRAFPEWFGFNVKFLEMLAYHAYSSRFVEFMGNTAKDWESALAGDNGACSLWDTLLRDERCAATFDEPFEPREGVFIPRVSVVCRQVVLWDVFLKRAACPGLTSQAFDEIKQDLHEWEWWM